MERALHTGLAVCPYASSTGSGDTSWTSGAPGWDAEPLKAPSGWGPPISLQDQLYVPQPGVHGLPSAVHMSPSRPISLYPPVPTALISLHAGLVCLGSPQPAHAGALPPLRTCPPSSLNLVLPVLQTSSLAPEEDNDLYRVTTAQTLNAPLEYRGTWGNLMWLCEPLFSHP